MKKLFLLIAIISTTLLFNSCNDDNGNDGHATEMSVKINGEPMHFSSVRVQTMILPAVPDQPEREVYWVMADHNDASDEYISFMVPKNTTGSLPMSGMLSYGNATSVNVAQETLTLNLNINNATRLAGTFSGLVYDQTNFSTPSYTLTEGTFDVTF